jgi:hypothetical protein
MSVSVVLPEGGTLQKPLKLPITFEGARENLNNRALEGALAFYPNAICLRANVKNEVIFEVLYVSDIDLLLFSFDGIALQEWTIHANEALGDAVLAFLSAES